MNTRQQILDATERIIQAKGIARVTTKEIAREAGCAEGTLYKHFEHKEDLFLSVLQRHLPTFVEAVSEDMAGKETVQRNVEHISLAAIEYYDKLVPLATAFFADTDLLARHRAMMNQMQGGPERIFERVASYIEAEQRLGRIDTQLSSLHIATLILGPCFQYVFNCHFLGSNPFDVADEQFVTGLVQALMRGLELRER
ncbi:MAG TPA: TetR/AcrR family transcriptional regulator [Ktedonobacteraceae bacterium]|jgi:AcrR family transcriptional regulator|nr:TetR/AcrR family transcriptional regulator [Ktedonobacteraceae bacterium]